MAANGFAPFGDFEGWWLRHGAAAWLAGCVEVGCKTDSETDGWILLKIGCVFFPPLSFFFWSCPVHEEAVYIRIDKRIGMIGAV